MVRLTMALMVTLATTCTLANDAEDFVRALAQMKVCYSPSFSPDDRTLAFVSDMSGAPQVWSVPTKGGWPRQVTAFGDTIGSVIWSPTDDLLAVTAAEGGGMNTQIYLVSPHGTETTRITSGGRETNRRWDFAKDGKILAIGSNERDPSAVDGYFYSITDGTLEPVFQSRGIGTISDFDLDVEIALLFKLVGRGSNDLFLRNLASGEELLLTPHEGPGTYFGELSPRGDAVFLASNTGRDLLAFGQIPITRNTQGGLAAGDFEVLAERDDAELDGFVIHPDATFALLAWNVGGESRLELLNLENRNREPIAFGPELISGMTWSPGGDLVALTARGSTETTNIHVLDVDARDTTQVTHCSHPAIDTTRFARPALVRYTAHDGLPLSGWLYEPPTDGPAPYVLSFHGGPEGQSRPGLNALFQALLANDIGVFVPNIRGSSGFGKRFVNLDNQELRFDANQDIDSSARYLIDAGLADPNKLGITGGSYGGYAVMVAVTEYPQRFAAAVNLFGMVNFETFFANTEPWMAAISGTEYGDPGTQKDLLRRLSPIHKLDRVETPLLVIHGANDTNVPVVEAEQIVENLSRRGVTVE